MTELNKFFTDTIDTNGSAIAMTMALFLIFIALLLTSLALILSVRQSKAKTQILNYLKDKGFKMASFERIRSNIDARYTDPFLKTLVERYPHELRRARLKGGRPGLARLGTVDEPGGKLWVTHVWTERESPDFAFIVQKLGSVRLDVRCDSRRLRTTRGLWEQVEGVITQPLDCDAWAIFIATPLDESANNEIERAMKNAREARGPEFPVFGIGSDRSCLPAFGGVSFEKWGWAEGVRDDVAAAPATEPRLVPPVEITLHRDFRGHPLVVEARPRTEFWWHCVARVPISERGLLRGVHVPLRAGAGENAVEIDFGAGSMAAMQEDKAWFTLTPSGPDTASPTRSMYVMLGGVPTKLVVGEPERLTEVDISAAREAPPAPGPERPGLAP